MSEEKVIYQMKAAVVVADPRKDELVFQFYPLVDDPELLVSFPSASVGHFIAQVAGAHRKLALRFGDPQGALLPLRLTGAVPAESAGGEPAILLQFGDVFELGLLVSDETVEVLMRVCEQLQEPSHPSQRPKTH